MDIKLIINCVIICAVFDMVYTNFKRKQKMKKLAEMQANNVTDNNVEPIKADKE